MMSSSPCGAAIAEPSETRRGARGRSREACERRMTRSTYLGLSAWLRSSPARSRWSLARPNTGTANAVGRSA